MTGMFKVLYILYLMEDDTINQAFTLALSGADTFENYDKIDVFRKAYEV